MLDKVPVSLNTKVSSIDWSGQNVVIETNKGSIKTNKCILTVSTGVLSSGQIKFNPKNGINLIENLQFLKKMKSKELNELN